MQSLRRKFHLKSNSNFINVAKNLIENHATTRTVSSTIQGVRIFSWGKGDNGQLGLGDENDRVSPERVVSLKQEQWSSSLGISCGLFHSSLWSDGEIFFWGKGNGGRLGLGDEESRYFPFKLGNVPRIKAAALGGLHSLILTEGGEIYSFGFGGFGALGHGVFTRELVPKKLEILENGENGMKMGENIIQIAAGGSHSAAVTNSGKVFSWGRDEGEGRLGASESTETLVDSQGSVPFPIRVQGLPSMESVACGGFFSAGVDHEGEVWTWGGNSNSELGRGQSSSWRHSRPGKVTAGSHRFVQVACGGFHCAALDEEGKVWTWGRGGHGQLGHNSLKTENLPKVVEEISGKKVVKVSCGGLWTAAVTEEGELFAWGKNSESQLARPDLPRISAVPSKVLFRENLKILDICCGASHALAVAISPN